MKSFRNLWPELISWPNMLLAMQRCRRRKRYSVAAAEFDYDAMNNLLHLQRELTASCWLPGPYTHFRITDPKPRKISAAPFRDRIVHHAIVNVLEPVFERRFIYDSYACRRGKGTHRAVLRAQQFQRQNSWSLKTDIVKFFPSIDHEILLHCIGRVVRDADVMRLITAVIDSGRGVLDEEYVPPFFASCSKTRWYVRQRRCRACNGVAPLCVAPTNSSTKSPVFPLVFREENKPTDVLSANRLKSAPQISADTEPPNPSGDWH
jgi:hypothetical protein